MRLATLSLVLTLAAAVLLGSCGSSSGSSGSTGSTGGAGTTGQAQGVYVGTTSAGSNFDAIDLPNDTFYAAYGTEIGNVLYICGLATGQGKSSDGSYTANETDFDYCINGSQSVFTGSVSANYVAGVSMSGSLSETGNSTVTFNASVPPASQFNFSTAASLSAISGSWDGGLTDGESATVSIDGNGDATGTSSDGCPFTATLTPDSSGKNFFDVSLMLGGAPCLFANQTASGIAVSYLLSDGVTTQFIAGISSGSTFGIVFTAQR